MTIAEGGVFGRGIGGVRISIGSDVIEIFERNSAIAPVFQKGKLLVRPRPKEDSIRDNDKLIIPARVLDSLRVVLPDALSLLLVKTRK